MKKLIWLRAFSDLGLFRVRLNIAGAGGLAVHESAALSIFLAPQVFGFGFGFQGVPMLFNFRRVEDQLILWRSLAIIVQRQSLRGSEFELLACAEVDDGRGVQYYLPDLGSTLWNCRILSDLFTDLANFQLPLGGQAQLLPPQTAGRLSPQ